MNIFQYRAARKFLEGKLSKLMEHEDKPHAPVAFPPQNYTVYDIKGRFFYSVSTNVFREIINHVLVEATQSFPDKFGTGDALDVLQAIYDINPVLDFEFFKEFLRKEQFCCVIEMKDGKPETEVLRIDLFRHLKSSKKIDFVGGLFHAFKHFSVNGINLSTGNDNNDVSAPIVVIERAIKGFFFEERIVEAKNRFHTLLDLNEKYQIKFSFYYEEITGVYFINTIHLKGK